MYFNKFPISPACIRVYHFDHEPFQFRKLCLNAWWQGNILCFQIYREMRIEKKNREESTGTAACLLIYISIYAYFILWTYVSMLKSFPHSLAASHLVRDTDIRACKSASIQRGLSALPAAFRPNSSHAGHNSTPDDIRNDVGALCDLDRLEETAETWLHVIASDSSVSAIQKRCHQRRLDPRRRLAVTAVSATRRWRWWWRNKKERRRKKICKKLWQKNGQ